MTPAGAQPPRGRLQVGQRLNRTLERLLPHGSRLLILLVAFTALAALGIGWFPDFVPMVTLLVPLVVSNLVLGPRQLPWFVVSVLLVLAVLVPFQPEVTPRLAVSVAVMFGVGFLVLMAAFRRSTLGVAGLQGESMFVDLRDQIMRQGTIPALPGGWHAAAELRSAGGTPYAGDFVGASLKHDVLQVAVVDVSGKGQAAGTRALMLSGAIGGLIAALPPEDFLPAANEFLLRQDWAEGFATAIHLTLDLRTGHYVVRSAGHPPAALREAGSGRWRVLESHGPVLGLLDEAEFVGVAGEMRPGDAMLLYTDGLVETPNRDISLGIDKMLGRAEDLLRGDFEDGAQRLIESLGGRHDDRALLLVHRR